MEPSVKLSRGVLKFWRFLRTDSEKHSWLLIALGCLTFKVYSNRSFKWVWNTVFFFFFFLCLKYCLLRHCILSVFASNNRLKPFKFFYALGAICRWSCLPSYLRYSGDTVHSNQSFVGRVVLTNCLCRWLNSNSIRCVYETDTFAVVIELE